MLSEPERIVSWLLDKSAAYSEASANETNRGDARCLQAKAAALSAAAVEILHGKHLHSGAKDGR